MAMLEVKRVSGSPHRNISVMRNITRKGTVGSHAGECLRFMHIPKTGGTSIDSQNLNVPKGKRAFHTQMVPVYEKLSRADPLHRDAGQLFDWSHSNMQTYGPFMLFNSWAYSWYLMPDKETCHS